MPLSVYTYKRTPDSAMSGLQLPTKTDSEGTYVVWDVVPRDVSVDADGDMYVIDAEINYV